MSLTKIFFTALVVVCAAIVGLIYLERIPTGSFSERLLHMSQMPSAAGAASSVAVSPAPLAGAQAGSGAPDHAAKPSGATTLANDARRSSAPETVVNLASLDPETQKRYQNALDDIEIDGCSANGTFAVHVRHEALPRIVRSGQTVLLPTGLAVTLKLRGYPACKVMLYDEKVAIGEVFGF